MTDKSTKSTNIANKTPKQKGLDKAKAKFIDELAKTGVVTRAAEASGLKRNTAYSMASRDEEFRKAWHEAMEIAHDKLLDEARTRALEKSDRLLIYLLDHYDRRHKRRAKLREVGRAAIDNIKIDGRHLGLSEIQVEQLVEKLLNRYESIII